jgi:hypothetical protein
MEYEQAEFTDRPFALFPLPLKYFLATVGLRLSLSMDEFTDGSRAAVIADVVREAEAAESVLILGVQVDGDDIIAHVGVVFEAQGVASGEQMVASLQSNIYGEDVFSSSLRFLSIVS